LIHIARRQLGYDEIATIQIRNQLISKEVAKNSKNLKGQCKMTQKNNLLRLRRQLSYVDIAT
jgi:hypothetical protein